MAGFDADSAGAAFDVPSGVQPLAVVAVGLLGDYDSAPADLVERDSRPRTRQPLEQVAFAERWGDPAQL